MARIIELAEQCGRYGCRRVTAPLRREGWRVNHKRVERIRRAGGLKVPVRQPRRRRLWLDDGSCVRLRPEYKDHVWSYDFVQTRTGDGRALRLLTLIDEYTRECLSIDVARRLNHDDVPERLAWLMATRGVPAYIRSADGSESTAHAVRGWLKRVGVKTLYIEPGSPWENGYIESFNGKLRDELLNVEWIDTVLEARVLIERWRRHHNTARPHMALGYRPPAPEAVEIESGITTGGGSGSQLNVPAGNYSLFFETWKVDEQMRCLLTFCTLFDETPEIIKCDSELSPTWPLNMDAHPA